MKAKVAVWRRIVVNNKNVAKKNAVAKVFCVIDLDTLYLNKKNQEKHLKFEESLKNEIEQGFVVLCPSMPSIEYWFLLHFNDYTDLIKSCGRKMQRLLSPYMMPYFPDTGKKLLSMLNKKILQNK